MSGDKVIIPAGATVTMDANQAIAIDMDIFGTLKFAAGSAATIFPPALAVYKNLTISSANIVNVYPTGSIMISRIEVFDPVRYCGENSIVIYLAFFLPMGIMRTILIKSGVVSSVGMMALIVMLAGIFGALALWWAVRETWMSFLFRRPDAFKLPAGKPLVMQPAE